MLCTKSPTLFHCHFIIWIDSQKFWIMFYGTIVDIDECETGDNLCDENAFCYNTRGSYKCDCKPGFEGNGYACRGKIFDCQCSLFSSCDQF